MNVDSNNEHSTGNSGFIRDVIIGVSDGLTVPFALTTGLSVVFSSTNTVFVTGLLATAVGAAVMGVGGYFTILTEGGEDVHEHEQKLETSTTKQFYSELGLAEEEQDQAAIEISKDREEWLAAMKLYEATIISKKSAATSGLLIAMSYILGGIIPTLPYAMFEQTQPALKFAAIVTTVALFLFGWLKGRSTGTKPWHAAFRETVIGLLAAGSAFLVAQIFKS